VEKLPVYTMVVLLLCNAAVLGCSQKEETAENKKGAIETMTDQAADELTNRIRTPIEKARSAANQQEDRMRSVDDQLKEE